MFGQQSQGKRHPIKPLNLISITISLNSGRNALVLISLYKFNIRDIYVHIHMKLFANNVVKKTA